MEMNVIYSALSLGALGFIFGSLLGYASNKFEVEVDERVPKIKGVLPGANCGGCGYPGCEAYATAVVSGEAEPNLCSVGGAPVAEKVGGIMGVKVEVKAKKVAFVKCSGNCDSRKIAPTYEGCASCIEAYEASKNDPKGCTFGCLGLGTCVNACKFDAIHVIDGVAVVDEEKCVNCGACIKTCPIQLIESVSTENKVRVQCNSTDNGKTVRENCSAGCIGCKMCERNCPHDAVHVNEFLAKVDYEKCISCKACTVKCPTKVIREYK